MSISFGFKNKDEVLVALKSLLPKHTFGLPQPIAYGQQFDVFEAENLIGKIRVYSTDKKGTTVDLSAILNEANRNLIEEAIKVGAQVPSRGKCKLPQTFWLTKEVQIEKIKQGILDKWADRCKLANPPNMTYAIKLNGVTISQWGNGRLTIQGIPTTLCDELIETISHTLEGDVITSLLNNYENIFVQEKAVEIAEKIKNMEIKLPIDNNLFYYLYSNDQIEIVDAIKFLEFVKQQGLQLNNYVSLVRNFAVVFEGFLIKLFIEMNLIDPEKLIKDEREGRVGKILNTTNTTQSEFEIKFGSTYLRAKPYLSAKLDSLWKECRNKYLHSDHIAPPILNSTERAEAKIHEILMTMEELFQLFGSKIAVELNSDIDKISCIGTDESGKGDYFGPLVVAGVYVDPLIATKFITAGVMDSKLISDKKIFELEKIIKEKCKHDVIVIGPKRYNELYEKLQNLNKLLAWGHARALENVLTEAKCGIAIADQFGDEQFIKDALMEKGRTIRLIQTPKAERNISVAAASILARAAFLRALDTLSKEIGIQLVKGSSNQEIPEIAKKIVAEYGEEKLKDIVKIHFKTTESVLAKN